MLFSSDISVWFFFTSSISLLRLFVFLLRLLYFFICFKCVFNSLLEHFLMGALNYCQIVLTAVLSWCLLIFFFLIEIDIFLVLGVTSDFFTRHSDIML